jgi:hypothetical protein
MRCIGICAVNDQSFMGECETCESTIFFSMIYAERLLQALDEERNDGYWAGTEFAGIHRNPFTSVIGNARTIHSRIVQHYRGPGDGWHQTEPYGIGKHLGDAAAQLVASLEAYKALSQQQRPKALQGIHREVERFLGVLRQTYQTPGTEQPVSVASSTFRRPETLLDALHQLSPAAFEHLVADLLKAQGYEGVKIIGGANDRGVDILCRDTDGSLIAVQCKRYDPNKPSGRVGAPVVQLLSAMALQRRAHRGILVTTATFTASARKQAYDFDIELINGEALVKQLSAHPHVLSSLRMR